VSLGEGKKGQGIEIPGNARPLPSSPPRIKPSIGLCQIRSPNAWRVFFRRGGGKKKFVWRKALGIGAFTGSSTGEGESLKRKPRNVTLWGAEVETFVAEMGERKGRRGTWSWCIHFKQVREKRKEEREREEVIENGNAAGNFLSSEPANSEGSHSWKEKKKRRGEASEKVAWSVDEILQATALFTRPHP